MFVFNKMLAIFTTLKQYVEMHLIADIADLCLLFMTTDAYFWCLACLFFVVFLFLINKDQPAKSMEKQIHVS